MVKWNTVKCNASTIWIVESFDKLDDGRLTTARWTNEGGCFSGFKLATEVLKYLKLVGWIREADVFEDVLTTDKSTINLLADLIRVNVRHLINDVKGQASSYFGFVDKLQEVGQ